MTPTASSLSAPPVTLSEDDPFRYGWRDIFLKQADGTIKVDRMPLTLEDVLHPQEGDVIAESTVQGDDRRYLHDIVRARVIRKPTAMMSLADCLIDLGIEGLPPLAPDIAVFSGVRNRNRQWTLFRMVAERARPRLFVEIVSPKSRNNDVRTKLIYYHQAGVPLYVIIDQQREGGPRSLLAYRHVPGGYVRLPLDERGRILLEVLGLYLGLKENRAVCYDAVTDEELGDYVKLGEERDEALKQAAKERKRTRAENKARQQAERQAREQTEARQQAERQAREQTEARQQAERQAREQAKARKQAERQVAKEQKRAQAEHKARQQAEDRLRDLEEQLRRLRGQEPPLK